MAQEFITHWVERGKPYSRSRDNSEDAIADYEALRDLGRADSIRTVNSETGYMLRRYVKRKMA